MEDVKTKALDVNSCDGLGHFARNRPRRRATSCSSRAKTMSKWPKRAFPISKVPTEHHTYSPSREEIRESKRRNLLSPRRPSPIFIKPSSAPSTSRLSGSAILPIARTV